jgi:hypothetical protein
VISVSFTIFGIFDLVAKRIVFSHVAVSEPETTLDDDYSLLLPEAIPSFLIM